MLLAANGWRSGELRNTPHCTGGPQDRATLPQMSMVLRWRSTDTLPFPQHLEQWQAHGRPVSETWQQRVMGVAQCHEQNPWFQHRLPGFSPGSERSTAIIC